MRTNLPTWNSYFLSIPMFSAASLVSARMPLCSLSDPYPHCLLALWTSTQNLCYTSTQKTTASCYRCLIAAWKFGSEHHGFFVPVTDFPMSSRRTLAAPCIKTYMPTTSEPTISLKRHTEIGSLLVCALPFSQKTFQYFDQAETWKTGQLSATDGQNSLCNVFCQTTRSS